MSNRVTIPPDTEPIPVTAGELARQMDRLLTQVAPRVVSDPGLPADEATYCFIEASSLIVELSAWTSDN